MSKTLRYGILGCGMMGKEHIRNIALIDGASVTAVADPDGAMQTENQAMLPEARFCHDLDELLSVDDFDALLIASPNYQHAEQLLTVFERTQLPILVEKPICTTIEDVARVREAAAAHPAPIWVAMEYRYMPAITQFVKQVRDGDIGPLQMATICEHRFPFLEKVGDWNRFNRNSGGTLVEKCCHFFDLMRLLTQDEAVRVMASGAADHNHQDETYEGETPDIIDNAFVIVDFASGKRAMLELNMFAEGSRFQERITAIGPKAKLECLLPGPGRFWPEETLGPAPVSQVIVSPREPKGPIESEIPVDPTILEAGDHNGSTYYQHVGFYKAVTEGAEVEVTVEDGLKAVVIGMAAQESIRSGRAVEIVDGGFGFNAV
ncbi:Gfo/Idh/MocA family protein [Leucothrix pacifica]|uniref:Oxidoreductase n=1 Tax=Leucothrix pacifica TaxID=1247513 RepID=A0A317C6R4_9GAMM|nr:Gfo/Idh/MocA family oxidoreductase [Leucothrix pacifica]PWQ94326.1 oxidoreductase [Leucothrix pacifica]